MKSPRLLRSCFIIGVTALCLGVVLLGWLGWYLPSRAERAFGQPTRNLGLEQQIFISLKILLEENDLKTPFGQTSGQRPFKVQLGESTYAITSRLEQDGFISSAAALRDYLIYSGLDTTIQAGSYKLSQGKTGIEIAQALQDSTPSHVTFHILSGWRMEEIADSLSTSGLSFSREAFLDIVSNPAGISPLVKQLPEGATLEGFLYPDSYDVPRQIPLEDFIKIILDDFQSKVDQDMLAGFKSQGLNLFQAVTLASMVEREAVLEEEMPTIASVFLNRLNTGMKLDSDPTVQYALGYDSENLVWWKNPLSLDDLKVQSPYNTYQMIGLPPGPIDNPRLSALRAVAFPAQTPYYYFRAACDGSGQHAFSKTFEEHQQKACP